MVIIGFELMTSLLSPPVAWAGDIAPLVDGTKASLIETKKNNEREMAILREQIDFWHEYMSSNGTSLKITIQRHSDTLPDYVIVLGGTGGLGSIGFGGSQLIGQRVLPGLKITQLISEAVAKRFVVVGIGTLIVSGVGAYFVRNLYSNTDSNKERNEVLRQIEGEKDEQIRNRQITLMVRQLTEFEEQNHCIDIELSGQPAPPSCR